jgi:hypothetical protein
MKDQGNSVVKVVGGLSLMMVLACGCLKPEEFPKEPRVTFKSFDLLGDSASLVIAFTDGDGDIGLDPSDSGPPFDTASSTYFNLFVEYSELREGAWVTVPFAEPIAYRIPRITPMGQNKTLEGEIAVAIDPFPLFIQLDSGTVRYSVELLDRALNRSNKVFSREILVDY